MELVPPIRTASPPAPLSHYQAYLNSPDWRRVRNRALKNAGWRCERCVSKRDLQVHHKTYERLGREWDTDLEVLCANCHEDEHLEQLEQSPDRIYLKLASEALNHRAYASIGDLSEDVKLRCVALKIPYDGPKIHRALQLLTGTRLTRKEPAIRADGTVPTPQPFSVAEAREFLCRFGLRNDMGRLCKSMPTFEKTPAEQRAHEERLVAQVAFVDRQRYRERREIARKKTFEEHLEEIFSTRPA